MQSIHYSIKIKKKHFKKYKKNNVLIFFLIFFINQSMSIPSEYCKSFFNITDVNEMYPRLTTYEAEELKNHFCFRTLYYIGYLRGYLKQHSLKKTVRYIIEKLNEEKEHNNSHEDFYDMLIDEILLYENSNQFEILEDYARIARYIQ